MSPASYLRLRFDSFEIDERDAGLRRNDVRVVMPPRAFAVLCTLARRPGQFVTKDQLLDAVWGHRHVSQPVFESTIAEVYAALGDDARQPRFVEASAQFGYRFVAELE